MVMETECAGWNRLTNQCAEKSGGCTHRLALPGGKSAFLNCGDYEPRGSVKRDPLYTCQQTLEDY